MKRPVMNPSFPTEEPPRRKPLIRLAWLKRILKLALRVMLADPLLMRMPSSLRIEDGSRLSRFVRGLMYRLTFVPVLVAIIVAALVFAGTHPPRTSENLTVRDPSLFLEPVQFISSDGTELHGTFVPVLSARAVLDGRESAIRQKHPAVILAHDFTGNAREMSPLVVPLHQAGIAVLALDLRGSGRSGSGVTFGQREAEDVAAAIRFLRTRPTIDGSRIGIVGVGTGATAALLAADADPAIRSLVLEDPVKDFDEVVRRCITPPQPVLRWLHPLCKWTFELSYHVNGEGLEMRNYSKVVAQRPTLMIDGDANSLEMLSPGRCADVRKFLSRSLKSVQVAGAGE